MNDNKFEFQSIGIQRLIRAFLPEGTADTVVVDAVRALEGQVRRESNSWETERLVGSGDNLRTKEIKQPKVVQKASFGKDGVVATFGHGRKLAVPSNLCGQVFNADALMALAEKAGLCGAYVPKAGSFLAKALDEWCTEFAAKVAKQNEAAEAAKAAKAAAELAQLG